MAKVCILGLGYVGLTLALHAAKNGYEVHGVEILESTRDRISRGQAHFHEPGLEELLRSVLGDTFYVHPEVPVDIDFDVYIISVGTPLSNTSEKAPNLDILDRSVLDVAQKIRYSDLLILRSTIPVGTSRIIEHRILSESALDSVNVSFCPERTAEGSALVELEFLPQVVSGNNLNALELAKNFFSSMCAEIIEASSLEEAELTKLFNNVYRDAIFSIANTFNKIAQSYGVDGTAAIHNANYNYPRSNIPKPGFVAGPCLEKDAYILASNMSEGALKDSILALRSANESLEIDVAAFIQKHLEEKPDSRVLISGIAFKGVPPTNDLRGSSGVKILNSLTDYANRVFVHDFMNPAEELQKHLNPNFNIVDASDFSSCEADIDLIVVLNNHEGYRSSKFLEFAKSLKDDGGSIFDAWNVTDINKALTLSNFLIKE